MSLDSTPKVDIYHHPKPATALIGRKTELAQLTEAFTNGKTRLAIIVAAGGIGKSALTYEWLQHIAQENYYGKTRVFGWSFYAQGTHTTYANSQEFFNKALSFLDVTEIPKDEIEKARLLVDELQKQPCLLILDGLEPLQYDKKTPSMNGELQDSALKEFILQFRQKAGKSFILFSSRQPLVEVTGKNRWHKEHFLELPLETLLAPPYDIEHDDGIALLKALEVKGSDEELHKISKDLNGHALSLVLMGHLLSEHHQGDCRYANELPPLTSAHGDSDAEKDSRHALRVLDYYDSLQDAASRCFLQLLGLFDRPMNAAEKAVLITNANHAEPLRALTDLEWKKVEQRLEKSGLLLGKKGIFERLEWDTHPIIRTYFGGKFKEDYPEAFKQAHEVLACYYYNFSEKKLPNTVEEMQPLYRAVAHGCLAEKYNFSLNEIYYKRIRRSDKNYSSHFLGAYAQDLTALSNFFSNDWSKLLKTDLSEVEQNFLLGEVSCNLMFLGRLTDAIEPTKAILAIHEKLQDWANAAAVAQNLTDLYLSLGQLVQAQNNAKLAYDYALQSTNAHLQVASLSYQAAALHHEAKTQEALKYFLQARNIAQQNNAIYLGSVYGYWCCTHLLDCTNDDVFLERLNHDLIEDYIFQERIISSNEKSALVLPSEYKQHLPTVSLAQLVFARISVCLKDFDKASEEFEQAISSIQKANAIVFTPPFYLYRADFYLTQNQLDSALADLNSALEIIERCGMKLYAVDYLLIHGRYCLATTDFDTALNHYQEAKQLIEETGYHLRDAELDLFAAQICLNSVSKVATLDSKNANYYLQKAKNRIEEIGQWGLMPRWEAVNTMAQIK